MQEEGTWIQFERIKLALRQPQVRMKAVCLRTPVKFKVYQHVARFRNQQKLKRAGTRSRKCEIAGVRWGKEWRKKQGEEVENVSKTKSKSKRGRERETQREEKRKKRRQLTRRPKRIPLLRTPKLLAHRLLKGRLAQPRGAPPVLPFLALASVLSRSPQPEVEGCRRT